MCCCNNSQPRLCKSSWRQPAEFQQSQYLFPFFIGWVWLLRGCSEVCRAHLTAARAELLSSHLYLRKKWDSPLLLWAHRGIFNTSVGDAVSSAIISPWLLHVTSIAGDGVQHSMWKRLTGQLVTERHISSSGSKILQFSIFYRKEDAWKKKRTRGVQPT